MLKLKSKDSLLLNIRFHHLSLLKESVGSLIVTENTVVKFNEWLITIKPGEYTLHEGNTGMEQLIVTEKVEALSLSLADGTPKDIAEKKCFSPNRW